MGAQGTLCDCRPTPAPCGEGGLDEIGAIDKSPTDLYSDVVGARD